MARLERPQVQDPNPATKWLEWKSNDKNFSYYDKEKGENIPVELPFKFLFLEHYHKCAGWHDASGSGINSNEIYGIGQDPLKVYSYGGGEIAEGLYKDIKDKVKSAGGRYTRSIYGMLEDGSIINIQLRGSAVGGLNKETAINKEDVVGWSGFYRGDKKLKLKGFSHLLDNQFIEVKETADGKKGSVKFSIPVFEIGAVIDKKTDALANKAAAKLQAYITAKFSETNANNIEVVAPEAVPAGDVDDDLEDLDI